MPEDNKSKIEEPLIYKTMHNCIETSSYYFYNNVLNQYSAYFTPKQQSLVINPLSGSSVDLILGSGGKHLNGDLTSKRVVHSAHKNSRGL